MTRDKIKEGDICTLDESVEYSYNPHKPYEVVVLWHGVNSQPLVTKLDEYNPFWTTYSQLIEVKRHIDLSIKALEQQTCEDAVSREAVLDEINRIGIKAFKTYNDYSELYDFVETLLPVNPQPKTKTGHWIVHPKGIYAHLICDNCLSNAPYDCRTNYCPDCGAKMVEPQESEDKCSNCAKSWTDNCPRNKCWDNDYSEFIKEREVSE